MKCLLYVYIYLWAIVEIDYQFSQREISWGFLVFQKLCTNWYLVGFSDEVLRWYCSPAVVIWSVYIYLYMICCGISSGLSIYTLQACMSMAEGWISACNRVRIFFFFIWTIKALLVFCFCNGEQGTNIWILTLKKILFTLYNVLRRVSFLSYINSFTLKK